MKYYTAWSFVGIHIHWRRKQGGGAGGHVPPTFASGGGGKSMFVPPTFRPRTFRPVRCAQAYEAGGQGPNSGKQWGKFGPKSRPEKAKRLQINNDVAPPPPWNVDDDVTQAMQCPGACGYLCKISGK